MQKIQFRNAREIDEPIPLLIELAGPSWSGKTYSALRLATGIGGPVFFVDTEEGRGAHYRHKFDYQYIKMAPPFTYARYMLHIKAAIESGAGVVITDSISHGHEGEGGYLQQHDDEVDRMMKASSQSNPKRDAFNAVGWIKPARDKNDFVLALGRLALDVPLIFCFRAKEKIKLVKDSRGKTQIVDAGWQPITSAGIDFEMTLRLMLPANSGGVPDLTFESTKVLDDHRPIIGENEPLSEAMGAKLAEWAANKPASQPIDVEQLRTAANAMAEMGMDRYRDYFQGLSNAERKALEPWHDGLKKRAEAIDKDETSPAAEPEAGVGISLLGPDGELVGIYPADKWPTAYNDLMLSVASDPDYEAIQQKIKEANVETNQQVLQARQDELPV